MRSAPTITASDVSTRRTRVGSDTVSYELAILTGEARAGDFDAASGVVTPGTTAARVYEALGLCDNSTATQKVGTSEWAAPLVGGARIASCAIPSARVDMTSPSVSVVRRVISRHFSQK